MLKGDRESEGLKPGANEHSAGIPVAYLATRDSTSRKLETAMSIKSGDRVLVTGGCGFIGSALVRELRTRHYNARIRVIDSLCTGTPDNLEGLGVELIEGDILEAEKLQRALDNIDIVFHLAALPFIPFSYQDPSSHFRVNAGGSMELFKGALSSGVRLVVYVSTCEVYGIAQSVPTNEAHPTNPVSIYAASKLAAEKVAYALYKEHGLQVVILRPFNTYGPRDSFPRVLPELISQLHKGKELILGNIEASRDFNYVEDVARGVLLAASASAAVGRVINLCSGIETSIRDLAMLVARTVGVNDYRFTVDAARLRRYDVDRFLGDGALARELLGWEPEVPLQEGIDRTVRWYRESGRWLWER